MGKRFLCVVTAALVALMLLACAAPAADKSEPTETAAQSEQMAGMVSPMHDMADYAALLAAQPQTMMLDAPAGATNVTYCYIDNEPVISQIQFTFGDNEYTYRAAACNEAAQVDIAGMYYDFNEIDHYVTEGGMYTLRYIDGEGPGLASWYYTPTKCQYSLSSITACSGAQEEGYAMEDVVDMLLPIRFDASGAPLALPANTPLPAIETGTLTGTVVSIQPNVLTVTLGSTTTLQFMLSFLDSVPAKVGDVVEITYSGEVLDAPEAMSVTVVTAAPEDEPTDTVLIGTVFRYTSKSVFVQTTSGNTFGLIVNARTAFSGKSTSLAAGNSVRVTYTGDLSDSPIATAIETTAVAKPGKATPAPEKEPVNKTLIGTVTELTSKRVTIYTDDAHSYSFLRTKNTYTTGNYTLQYGSRIRVLYDGYAVNTPEAKRIEVLAPPDPTPPKPTPYVPSQYTIDGLITGLAGNSLEIYASNGRTYSFLLRSPTIIGSVIEGNTASVTYQIEQDGSMNVTKIYAFSPEPTPYVPTTYTIYGTITATAGNSLSVETYDGDDYSFLLRSPSISGSIVVGYDITLSYQIEQDGSMNVTRIVTSSPIVYDDPDPIIIDEPDPYEPYEPFEPYEPDEPASPYDEEPEYSFSEEDEAWLGELIDALTEFDPSDLPDESDGNG